MGLITCLVLLSFSSLSDGFSGYQYSSQSLLNIQKQKRLSPNLGHISHLPRNFDPIRSITLQSTKNGDDKQDGKSVDDVTAKAEEALKEAEKALAQDSENDSPKSEPELEPASTKKVQKGK